MKIILIVLLFVSVSCARSPKGAEVSLRLNGIPVFMSQPISEVDVADGFVMIQLDVEDSKKLKLYIDEFYKDGGNIDVYIAETPYVTNLYLQSNYSDNWRVLKLPWSEALNDVYVNEGIKVNYLTE